MQFSIITPSFRASRWLKLCIASVADQDQDVEHIVQDSCSDDGTADWLVKDPRVKAFIEKDEGMYDAINRGFAKAHGDICAYLNCDEQYLPGTLARVASFFAMHPEVDVLFGDAVLINAQGKPLSYRRAVLPKQSHVRLAHLNTLSCAMFFRRKIIEKGYLFDPKLKDIGDAAWVETLLKAGVPVATLRRPLAVFTFTGENRSASRIAKAEISQRRTALGRFLWLRKAMAILRHRMRKAAAGAYRRRHVKIEIYTLSSPSKRQHSFGHSVGFGWPTQ
jgi:glycosyltransferase involved in cell wall biosynthesis